MLQVPMVRVGFVLAAIAAFGCGSKPSGTEPAAEPAAEPSDETAEGEPGVPDEPSEAQGDESAEGQQDPGDQLAHQPSLRNSTNFRIAMVPMKLISA